MKKFWQSYVVYYKEHPKAIVLNVAYYIGFGLISWAWSRSFPYLFFIGYAISDPVSYYIFRFRQLTIDEREAVDCDHEPLMVRDDGTPIRGTKCCKFCGLNEAYWPATDRKKYAEQLK